MSIGGQVVKGMCLDTEIDHCTDQARFAPIVSAMFVASLSVLFSMCSIERRSWHVWMLMGMLYSEDG